MNLSQLAGVEIEGSGSVTEAYVGGQVRAAFTKVVSEKVEKGKQI